MTTQRFKTLTRLLCLPDSLLFREERDERAFAHLSRTKMRKKDGVIEGKRLSVWGEKELGRRQYIHVLAEIGGKEPIDGGQK